MTKGGVAGSRPIARMGDRLIALVIDSIVGAVAFAVIGMYAAIRFGGLKENGFSLEGEPALIGIGGALIIGFLYYWLLEGLFGVTLGKAIVGLRVRDESGGACGLKASLVRNLLRVVDGLAVYLVGFLVAVLSKRRQRLGDHLAKTVVIEDPPRTLVRALIIALWFVVIAGGGWLSYRMHVAASASATVDSGKTVTGKVPPPLAQGSPPKDIRKPPPIQAEGKLAVVNFAFLQEKDGSVRPTAPYRPGDKVHTRFGVKGFGKDEEGRPRLLFDVVPTDPGGLKLYGNWEAEFEEPWEDPAEPVPTTYSFDLADYVPAGSYTLHIKVKDAVRDQESVLSPAFTVEAVHATPASKLEIRDFRLSRTEGGVPEPQMVLTGGGKLYIAFKVTGIRFREDRMDVNVAMRILGPGGEVVLEKADLVDMGDDYFYHPPTFFKEITSWATLPSHAPKGTYTASFAVTDRFAEKTVRHEGRFEVR